MNSHRKITEILSVKREFNIGSIVPFGGYHWRILDIQGNAVLIITEYMIEQHPYNNCAGDVIWADCSLRKYLNGEFYNKFTAAEQSRIIPVLNKNYDNLWYSSRGGDGNIGIQGNGTFSATAATRFILQQAITAVKFVPLCG